MKTRQTRENEWTQLAKGLLDRARHKDLDLLARFSASRRLSVRVTRGELEQLRQSSPSDVSLRVFRGERTVSGSTSHVDEAGLAALLDRLVASVDLVDPDAANGLAEPELLVAKGTPLDLYDESLESLDVDRARALAAEAEKASFAVDPRVKNSSGASCGVAIGQQMLVSSGGARGTELWSSVSLSASPIAEDDQGEKFSDGWWEERHHMGDLPAPETIGRIAGSRALSMMGARRVKTGRFPVLFAPETAGALIGHLFESIAGDAIYKRSSFLVDREGTLVASPLLTLVDDPLRLRGLSSAAFDAEGVATRRQVLVEKGVLQLIPCDTYAARKLRRRSTGHSGGGGSVRSFNLFVEAGSQSPEQLLEALGTGLFVTSFIGFGFNRATGDFSRGVRGFWVEKGKVMHPVQEVTVSGHLGALLDSITAVGSDLVFRAGTDSPSLLVSEMMVSGID